jgi:phosphatidylglycerophosphate synthase
VLLSAVGGACLAVAAATPIALLLVPVVAALRLVLNVLDGMVARAAASGPRAIGEIWNEVGDRTGDALFLVGLAAVPAVGPWLGLGSLLMAIAASYVGLAAKAAGGRRLYGGVMSKPGRMVVLSVAAPVAFVTSEPGWLAVAAWIILIGSTVTVGQRLWTAIGELDGAG